MNKNLKRDINFFAVIGQDSGGFSIDFNSVLKKCIIVFVIIGVVVVGIMASIAGVMQGSVNALNEKIAALEEPLKEIEELKATAEGLQMDIDTFNNSVNEFNTQSRLTMNDIRNIAVCMPSSVTLNSLSYSGDTVSLSCTGTSELVIAEFANALRNSQSLKEGAKNTDADKYYNDFANVQYTGVSKSGDSTYSSTIIITLNSRADTMATEENAEASGEEAAEAEE